MAIFPVTRLHDIAVTDHHAARRGPTEPALIVVLADVGHKTGQVVVIKAIVSGAVVVAAPVPAVVPVRVFAVMFPIFVLIVAMAVVMLVIRTIRPRPAGQRAWANRQARARQHHHQQPLAALHKLSLLRPPWKALVRQTASKWPVHVAERMLPAPSPGSQFAPEGY